MRAVMAERCGLVRSENPCRCSNLVPASIKAGITDPKQLHYAHHGGVEGPIETGMLKRAANELETAVAMAEVFRSDPEWQVPETVWERVRDSLPTLLRP
jgi:hypothetical protein